KSGPAIFRRGMMEETAQEGRAAATPPRGDQFHHAAFPETAFESPVQGFDAGGEAGVATGGGSGGLAGDELAQLDDFAGVIGGRICVHMNTLTRGGGVANGKRVRGVSAPLRGGSHVCLYPV